MNDRTLDLVCPHCRQPVHCSKYHAGFSNEGFLYCDSDESVLTWDSYSPRYTAIVDKHPWSLDEREQALVESALKPCPCGGHFRFNNPPRCLHCHGDLSLLLLDRSYFVVCGTRFDADRDDLWLPAGPHS